MPVFGLLCFLWFLLRVLPKPSRAAYPCQRAAAPFAAAFITWFVGVSASALHCLAARRLLRKTRPWLALLCVIGAVTAAGWTALQVGPFPVQATEKSIDPPNAPMGLGKGIFPGRVVWVHDPGAASWDGLTGNCWDEGNVDGPTVAAMLSTALQSISGADTDAGAWAAVFAHFDEEKGQSPAGYAAGEKIAVKVNMNQAIYAHRGVPASAHITTPQLLVALLTQLVEEAGVPEEDIAVYDVCRFIPGVIYDPCHAAFPGVRFFELNGGDGREMAEPDLEAPIQWSWGDAFIAEVGGGNTAYLPACVTEAAYLINLANLRPHDIAGITLCGKNHFGSFCADVTGEFPRLVAPKGAGLHPYITAHPYPHPPAWDFAETPMGSYTPLVDLMGHEDLGAKTLLCLIDGLYSTHDGQGAAVDNACRWMSVPFNGDWTSSLFMSMDPVAIDSVAGDFLDAEPSLDHLVYGTFDNYLHEAAKASAPPSAAAYDPEGNGATMGSLGVHEHWNNATDKRYTRNLGLAPGIELVGFSPAGNIPPAAPMAAHSADQNTDYALSLYELLRLIQFFNGGGYHCAGETEDGFAPGPGDFSACTPHTGDYAPHDGRINLSELLRAIQFYNSLGCYPCPAVATEDGYCTGQLGG